MSQLVRQPSLDAIKKAIAQLRALDLESVTFDELKPPLELIVTGWHVTAPVFDAGLRLFRATARFQNGPPPRVCDFSYPPFELSRLGRANRGGSPLLYCSAARNAVFFEMGVAVGRRLALIRYDTTCPLLVNRIGFTEETFTALQTARVVPDYGRLNIESYTEADHLINDFLSEVFCQRVPDSEAFRYKISAAVAEVLLGEKPEPIQGLMYPTVPMWANADNFALRPRFADRCLQPIYAEYVEVTKVADQELGVAFLDEARRFRADGSVEWLGHEATWRLEGQGTLTFEETDGHWVARDHGGTIVDPK